MTKKHWSWKPEINKKYSMLLVIDEAKSDNRGNRMVKVKCDCGVIKTVRLYTLRSGKVVSCGCWGKGNTIHGMKDTRFYKIWQNIKTRCDNPNAIGYKYWGGKGIKHNWNKFLDFKDDMHKTYLIHSKLYGEKNTFIERVNGNDNYCVENCKWATRIEQNNNTCSNKSIKYNNKKYKLKELCEKLNINYSTLYGRIFVYKMPLDMALDTKKYPRH